MESYALFNIISVLFLQIAIGSVIVTFSLNNIYSEKHNINYIYLYKDT